MLSTKKEKKEPCYFLEKLFNILSDKYKKKHGTIIHWSKDGHSIIIVDPNKFTNKIMPNFFNTRYYSSFIRQLNLYGFTKMNNILNSKEEHYIREDFNINSNPKDIKITKKKVEFNNNNKKKDIKEEEKKEQILKKEEINKETNDNIILNEYRTLVQNSELNSESNTNILLYLIQKVKQNNDVNNEISNKISNLRNKIDSSLNEAKQINEAIDYINQNNIKNDGKKDIGQYNPDNKDQLILGKELSIIDNQKKKDFLKLSINSKNSQDLKSSINSNKQNDEIPVKSPSLSLNNIYSDSILKTFMNNNNIQFNNTNNP